MRYESNQDLIRFLRANTNLIILTFNRSGTRNLRILKHALNDFKKIYEMVNNSYPNTSHRVMQTMLIFTIAVSFEIKAGKIIKDKFINIKDNEEYKSILLTSRVLMDNRQFYIKEFDNNYYYNFKSEYRFFKFIEYYVRTRIFDMKIFKENMETIRNTIDTENLPAYKKILTEEYWKISDEKFEGIIEEVIEEVREGKITLIDTVKLYAYLSYFSRKGLIKYDLKSLKNIFFAGMNKASLNSKYCENQNDELNKIAVEELGEDMEDIIIHFNMLNNELLEKEYKEKADEIIKNIPMKMEVFYERFDKECMEIPIFKYCDAFQIFQRISCATNEDLVLIREKLIDRANKNTKKIEPEMKNIKQLKQIIDDYLKGKNPTIKNVMLKEFSRDLGYILDKYKISFLPKREEKTEEEQ